MLGVLLVVALSVRLYAIDRIPAVVFHDECDDLVNAYQILNGRGPGFFGLDWKPQPAASVYLLSWLMRLHASVFSLRLPAAIGSVAALIPFYFWLRRAVAAPAALLAAGLLACDVWYLHFSRVGWSNVHACLFLNAAALCMHDALRTGRLRTFAWAGLWSACGAYGYAAGQVILPAVLATAALTLVRPVVPRKRLLAGIAVTSVTAAALFAPQLPSIVSQWSRFQERNRFVFVLAGENQRLPTFEQIEIVLAGFGRKTEQLFAEEIPVPLIEERPDRYLRVDHGALARPTAVLLAAGMAVSVTSVAWFAAAWEWWLVLVTSFFFTQALTIGSLNGARGLMIVPILYLWIGLVLHLTWDACARLFRPLTALVIVAAIVLAASTTRQYFAWVQSPALLEALEPAIPIREFPEWQAYVRQWIAANDGFFNLDMYAEHRRAVGQPE